MKDNSRYPKAILLMAGLMIMLLTACETSNPAYDQANAVYQSGNLELALQRYEQLLGTPLDAPTRNLVTSKIANIKRELATDALRKAEAYAGSTATIEACNTAIQLLKSRLQYDTADGLLAKGIRDIEDRIQTLNERIEVGLIQAETKAKLRKWNDALVAIAEVEKLDPGAAIFDSAKRKVFTRRNNVVLKDAEDAYAKQDAESLAVILMAAKMEQPAIEPRIVQSIEGLIERLREDLLPAKIDDLVAAKQYYRAVKLFETSDRPETLEAYKNLKKEAAQFYLKDTEKALSVLPKIWGKAYFSAVKAYELDPEDKQIFDAYLRVTGYIDELVQTKVGVISFDSPEKRQRSGVQFADGLISYLNERLPYGVKIADRSQIENLMEEKSTIRDQVFDKEKIDLLVRGNVSILDVERKQSHTADQLFVEIGQEIVPNPVYEEYRREYGSSKKKWPEDIQSTPSTIKQPVREQVTLNKTYEYAKGLMVISVSLVDAHKNTVLKSFEEQESYFKDDVYHGAIPQMGIETDPPELPSDFEIIENLRQKLAEFVGQQMLIWYDARENKMAEKAATAFSENNLVDSLLWQAKAHHFCRMAYQDKAKLDANVVYSKIVKDTYFNLAENESVYPVIKPRSESAIAAATAASGPTKWALVIGVSDYEDSNIPDINYAATDAKAFFEWVVAPDGGGVRQDKAKLLMGPDATLINIKTALSGWLKTASKNDTVTVFLAGHGSPASPDNLDDLYFIPYDAKYDAIAASCLPMDFITDSFDKFIQSENVVLLADACHSGGIGAGFNTDVGTRLVVVPSFSSGKMASKMTTSSKKLAILSSARDNQVSRESSRWRGGVFTQYLLEGLNNSTADADLDGEVTVEELFAFVKDSVDRETNGQQQPVLSGVNYNELVIAKSPQ